MGALMRQYWLPALVSSELVERDGRPVRLRLLSEDLIAFRDTTGRTGIMRPACPHRGASLFFGRNEADGLHCVYHGWKFDVTGKCIDMPNEPPEGTFKDKVRANAYPTRERGGIIWVYMGPRETPPLLPELEPNMVPGAEIWLLMRECNWVQALDGEIDTSHFGFLHMGSVKPEDTRLGSSDYFMVKDRTPHYAVVDMDYGTMYGAYRPADDDTNYWRTASFLFPFYVMVPTGVLGVRIGVRAWVPIDDEHTMAWNLTTPSQWLGLDRPGARAAQLGNAATGYIDHSQVLPNSSDWLGRWRLGQNKDNDYLLDPEAQKTSSYTGITGVFTQDQAITESMRPIVDRTSEHLGTADVMVIRTRQRLLRAAVALRDEGVTPPGVDDPSLYAVRSGSAFLPKNADWLAATAELRKAFVDHPEIRAEAEAGRF